MATNFNQKSVFLNGEGDSWFDRNNSLSLPERIKQDFILKEIELLEIKPVTVIEIGCSEGWRLNVIHELYGSECFGFDPSKKAISNGSDIYPDINLKVGTADNIEYKSDSVDLLIVGFCLYLCDRNDLFLISKEIDRVIKNKGIIIVLDFYSEVPYKNFYEYKSDVYSYKMDYEKMFTWNPQYNLISKKISDHDRDKLVMDKNERLAVNVIQKSVGDAYMLRPEFKC